jgi:hypothetical protein
VLLNTYEMYLDSAVSKLHKEWAYQIVKQAKIKYVLAYVKNIFFVILKM